MPMMALVEGILQKREQTIRCYKWDIIGLPSFMMLKIMLGGVIVSNVWGSLVELMKCLFRHK